MNTAQTNYEQAKERIKIAESLENLKKNKDFKEVILDNYLSSYANRLVMLLASVNMQTKESQDAIEASLRGISEFNQFLLYVAQEGEIAKKTIEDYNSEGDI